MDYWAKDMSEIGNMVVENMGCNESEVLSNAQYWSIKAIGR